MRGFSTCTTLLLAVFVVFSALRATATTLYVDANGTNPLSPYNSWSTAATNIQDALNVSTQPGALVLVTNGIYQYSGFSNTGSNRVYANNNQTIQSVNGPQFTTIVGYQIPGTTNGSGAARCVYLQKGCSMYGFTLTNGATENFEYGGGVYCGAPNCIVSNCIITGNAAYDGGGGAYSGTLINCQIIGNLATKSDVGSGGGAYESTLINCLLTANASAYRGAAAENSTLINCTVVTNIGQVDGIDDCKLLNSICYYNYPDNGESSGDGTSFTNCCVAGLPTFNSGNNFTNAPLFVNLAGGDFHLSPASPCINAGNNSYITNTTDLDGNPRIVYGIVDLGAYESPYNNPNVHYVSLSSTNPVPPYNGWTIAATNIQNAVDVSTNGDMVWVTNGVYQTGGEILNGFSLSNRVVINKPITVQSVAGPAVTIIQGNPALGNNNAVRCVYLTNNASLIGFTLTLGATLATTTSDDGFGGGVFCQGTNAFVSNCILSSNEAWYYGEADFSGTLTSCLLTGNGSSIGEGNGCAADSSLYDCVISNNTLVGAYDSTLNDCLVISNSVGASFSKLYNCTVVENRLYGLNGCTAYNSIIYYNYYFGTGPGDPHDGYGSVLTNCCVGSFQNIGALAVITNQPLFVNLTNDFHLQSNSPCINSGNNAYVTTATDFGGNPRIVGGTVDIGAYEYQTPASVVSYAYLEQYGLPTDGSVDYSDLDGTGFNVYQDWIAGLNPTNSSSVLAMLAPAAVNNATGITVSWQSVSSILYNLQRSTNLTAPSPFITIQSNIVGQAGTTSYQDTSATNNLPYFYRVGVP